MRLTTYSGDSHLIAIGSVRPFENLRIDLTWVLAISLVLSACGSSEPPATTPAAGTVAAPAAAPAVPAAPSPVDAKTSLTLANAAFRQNRIVAPAGDNALEHALNALKQDPENAGANEILVDLTPIAAAAIEAEITAGNFVEAERVMRLLSSANPNSLTVKGLQRRLATAARLAPPPAAPAAAPAEAVTPTQTPSTAAVVPAPTDTPAERETAPAPTPARDTRVVNTPPRREPEPATAPPAAATEPERIAANTTAAAAPAPPAAPPAAPPPSARPGARTSEPIPLVKVQPDYPPAAKKRRTEGWVELQFLVGVDGVPKQIEVIRAQPPGMFDRAAIRAMSRWKFKPAERDGQPVEARAKTTVGFKLG
jgi:periplasmic protein TonB